MFPYIETSGTHREIGRAIGEHLRPQIGKALDIHFRRLHRQEIRHHPRHIAALVKTTRQYFPDFLEEVKGIAEGARQELEQLLLFSFEEELSPGEHCTTLAVKGERTIFFAHNEDWDLGLPLYTIKAKPKKKPKFLSVAYAGQFPGRIGFNDQGFVFSDNSVQTKINFNGLPKNYCLRKFLECKTIDDAVKVISLKDRALGSNSVLVSAAENRVVSLEWSSRSYVLNEGLTEIGHTNHYISKILHPHQLGKASKSSRQRYSHVRENIGNLQRPKLADIKKIMKSHLGNGVAICQHGDYKTLTSVIVDTSEQKMYVAPGTPCDHRYQSFSL